jgi:hypothetical protein
MPHGRAGSGRCRHPAADHLARPPARSCPRPPPSCCWTKLNKPEPGRDWRNAQSRRPAQRPPDGLSAASDLFTPNPWAIHRHFSPWPEPDRRLGAHAPCPVRGMPQEQLPSGHHVRGRRARPGRGSPAAARPAGPQHVPRAPWSKLRVPARAWVSRSDLVGLGVGVTAQPGQRLCGDRLSDPGAAQRNAPAASAPAISSVECPAARNSGNATRVSLRRS